MGILKTILDAIFEPPAAAGTTQERAPELPLEPRATTSDAAGKPAPVDIDAVMTALAAKRREHLDWKHSVVDLLKTLGLDSSVDARERLAKELGNDHWNASASANEWLHDKLLEEIEKSGGQLPPELK